MNVFGKHLILSTMLGVWGAGAYADEPKVRDRYDSLISTFGFMCALKPPVFEHIAYQANAMLMQPLGDDRQIAVDGSVILSKGWEGNLKSGQFVLLLDEMTGENGTVTSCAIVGDVPDVDIFRARLIQARKIKEEVMPEVRPDGSRSFLWDNYSYPSGTLVLRDLTPMGKKSVMVKIIVKRKKGELAPPLQKQILYGPDKKPLPASQQNPNNYVIVPADYFVLTPTLVR